MAVPQDAQILMQRLKEHAEQGDRAVLKFMQRGNSGCHKHSEALVTATKEKEFKIMTLGKYSAVGGNIGHVTNSGN